MIQPNLSHSLNLKGKVALVTGGSRGIGRAISILFAKHGANIAISSTYKRKKEVLNTVKIIERMGKNALWVPGDISKPATGTKLIQKTVNKLGSLDILVNNAGIADSHPFQVMKISSWRNVISSNLDSLYYITQPAIKHLIKQKKRGSIIFISSIATRGYQRQANYAASKGGLEAFMRVIATEFGSKGIRSNAIAPGPVDTQKTAKMRLSEKKYFINESAIKRFLKPEEIANVALFLASELSTGINGTVIYADGGITRS